MNVYTNADMDVYRNLSTYLTLHQNHAYLLLGSTVQNMFECVVGYIIKGGNHADMQKSEF